ncbi:hypothetical protein K450DRAFT_238495 [Umbelopsis ramanniana AG]|uniref:Homeobox domain-containing protein n=1 Tax=Umbelopsis ramanniana AG TaxID=1314678 RepID=A0AAD5HF06_UMBRA|nr:uncharacterized protein K450DRAFT_238495 [Umbelopsis ramanniana AG]KAI8580171.1 hypothetical protein K450DRAFT_238495 [Umbelopsis ramanniana AG]
MDNHRPSPSPEQFSNDDARIGTRKRTRTTLNQLRVLEETFTERPSPDSKLRKQLSDDLGMSERSIQIWFQNRRAKVKLLKKRAKMKEEQQVSAKKASCSLPPSNKRPVDKPMAQPNVQPPRSVAARMPFHRAWSYDMAKDMPPPVVYSPAAHALPPHWNYPYYPMAPPPTAPPHHSYRPYPRPLYQQPPQPDQQLTDGMASLAFSDMMQSQQPLYHPPPTPTSYLLPISKPKQSFSLPPQTYRHGSQFSSSPTSDMTDESGRRYDPDTAGSSSMEPSSTSDFTTDGYLLANTITVGSWHRICFKKDDLQLQYNMTERLFSWHIRTEEYHFKMDISFDSISSIDYQISQVTPGAAEIVIDITDVPHFFMDMGPDGWLRCGDFTENAQATQLRQHMLTGEASQLRAQILQLAALNIELSNKIHMIEEEEEDDQQPFSSLVNFDWSNDEESINNFHRYSSMPILGNPGEDLSWP